MEHQNLNKLAEHSERYPFIAEHRGGPLSKENHRKLIKWARECSEHVLSLIDKEPDQRLIHALNIAKDWEMGSIPTGAAIKASLGAHAVARESDDPVTKAIARSIGQAVATAHMADHSLGGPFYALKAVKLANKSIEEERKWQTAKLKDLPSELVEIINSMWTKKELDRRI